MEKPLKNQSNPQPRRLKRQLQRTARRVLPFMASLFMVAPMASPISKSLAGGRAPAAAAPKPAVPSTPSRAVRFSQQLRGVYAALQAEQQGLRFEVFAKAMTGYLNLRQHGKLASDKSLLTVVDFDLPSTVKRLWVLDLTNRRVLFNTLVAHGHNTGENEATMFSNTVESNMSSLGFYLTQNEYIGKHGRSLKLQGLDEGFNTNAEARAVVMHGAEYVSEDFIRQNGRLGRSLGCPALPMDQYSAIIDTVSDGTCLFISKSDAGYDSQFLSQEVAIAAWLPEEQPAS
ncbi:hypothetical protein GCM10023185_04620 [Hymenobacter saemangeumensis]|uniref:Murein L,D-transpeptidase catalytic domain family protein n=1 Tax=Hymenobacter saemangeumensis TaxID=1084522 RepID=A0ABP8I084_9BACT